MSLWILTNANSSRVAQDLKTICPDPALVIDMGVHADGSFGSGAVSFQPAPTTTSVGCQMVQTLVSSPVAVGIRGEADGFSVIPVTGYTLDHVGGVTMKDQYPAPTLIEIAYDIFPCGGQGFWVTDGAGKHITAPTHVALYHEMAHAHDFITGAFTTVAAAEVSAVGQENQYRASQGLPQRAGHGGGCNSAPAPAAPPAKPGCFIATAAFGSVMEPEVQQLRSFRDDVLRQTRVGRLFFDTYWKHYYRISPFIVNAMQSDPEVKQVVRWSVVTPIVRYLELLLNFPDAPLDGIEEPWRDFLLKVRGDLETWTSEIELPQTFRGIDAPSAAEELGIILRYVLRSASSRADYLSGLERRGEIPLSGSACQLKSAAKRLGQYSVPEQDTARILPDSPAPPVELPVRYMNQDEVVDLSAAGTSGGVYQVVITCFSPFDQIAVFYSQTDNPNNIYFAAENNVVTGQVVVFNLGPCNLMDSYTVGFFVDDTEVLTLPSDDPIFQGQPHITPALDRQIHQGDPPCKSAWQAG